MRDTTFGTSQSAAKLPLRPEALSAAYDPRRCVTRRDVIDRVDAFLKGDPATSPRILYLRGEGGAGKTWFTHRLREHFASADGPDVAWSFIEFGEDGSDIDDLVILRTNLDCRRKFDPERVEALVEVEKLRVSAFTRFDYAVARFWNRSSPHRSLVIPRRAQLLGASEGAAAAIEIGFDIAGGAIARFVRAGIEKGVRSRLLRAVPELESLDRMPELEHRRRVSQYFIDDIRRYVKANEGRRFVLILDNFDAIARRGSDVAGPRDGWVAKLARDVEGVAIVLLGRTLPDWVAGDARGRHGARNPLKAAVVELDELDHGQADTLMRTIGIDDEALREAIGQGSRLPMVVTEKCRWVLKEIETRGAVAPGDIPRALDDVHEKLLLFRTLDEQRLLEVLALAGRFDRKMMEALARRLRLPVSDDGIDAILRSASVVGADLGWYRFHDLLNEHVVARARAATDGIVDTSAYAALFSHAVFDRDGDTLGERARFMRSAFALTMTVDGAAPNLPQPEDLPEALAATHDLVQELLAANLGSEATSLGVAALGCALRCLAADAVSDDGVSSTLDLMHVAIPEMYQRGGGALVSRAIALIVEAKAIFSRFLAYGGAGLPATVWRGQIAALGIYEARARNVFLPEQPVGSPIRSYAIFWNSFEAALCELLDALADSPAEFPQTRSLRLFAARTQSVLGHRLGRRGGSPKAIAYFDEAAALFKECRRLDTSPQLLQASAWHLLHPPKNRWITVDELRTALGDVEHLRRERSLDVDLLELWIRGLIRLAYKRRDGEIESDKPWSSALDSADAAVLARAALTSDRGGPHLLRLTLRLLRKRHNLGAPVSTFDEAMMACACDGIAAAPDAMPTQFYMIMSEIRGLLWYDVDKYALIAEQVYELGRSAFSPWQRGIALKALYEGFARADGFAPTPAGFSDDDLRSELLRPETLLVGSKSLFFMGRLYFDAVTHARRRLLEGGSYADVGAAFERAADFFAKLSRDHVVALGGFELSLAQALHEAGRVEAAQDVLAVAERMLLDFGPHDLTHYANALRLRKTLFAATLHPFDADDIDARLARIAQMQEEHRVAGSLLFAAQDRRASKDREVAWSGDRLAFEALSIAEHELPQDSAFRRKLRDSFGRSIWHRMARVSERVSRNAGKSYRAPSYVLDDVVQAFADGDKEYLLDDLKMLLASAATANSLGAIVFARYLRCETAGSEPGVVFEQNGEKIFVRRELLGRRLSSKLYTQFVPDDDDPDDDAEPDRAPTVEGLHMLNLIKPRNGRLCGTMVGPLFVRNGLQLFLPGIRYGESDTLPGYQSITNGASNSWSVVRIDAGAMSSALAGGGHMLKLVTLLLGLRRLTVVPLSHKDDPQSRLTELRHFLNNSWEALRILDIDTARLVVQLPSDEPIDPRKLRTWRSMFAKVYPEFSLEMVGESIDGTPTVGRSAMPKPASFDFDRY
jgi:hypothetical protein